jgi:uncharacterized membrane protein YfcA
MSKKKKKKQTKCRGLCSNGNKKSRDFIFLKSRRYGYVDGDVRWGPRETIRYPAICAVAGVFAGMFGIGGGIVKSPLMIEMGVLPEVNMFSSFS